jgi:hypothetical protein
MAEHIAADIFFSTAVASNRACSHAGHSVQPGARHVKLPDTSLLICQLSAADSPSIYYANRITKRLLPRTVEHYTTTGHCRSVSAGCEPGLRPHPGAGMAESPCCHAAGSMRALESTSASAHAQAPERSLWSAGT